MVRVYLDWNIWSSIKQREQRSEHYSLLYSILNKNKKNIYLPYSQTHLNDLLRSFSKSKEAEQYTYEDLDFLSELSQDLCLHYDSVNKEIKPIIFNARQAFENLEKNVSMDFDLDRIFSGHDDPVLDNIGKSIIKLLKSVPSGIDLDSQSLGTPELSYFDNFLVNTKKENNLYGVLKDMLNIINNPKEHSKIYTQSRNSNIERMKIDTNPKNWGEPFNYLEKTALKNSNGQSFKDVIDLSINNQSKRTSQVDNFITHYLSLDLFGYFRDNQLSNLLDDAMHAYNGAFCDCFITDDKNTLAKAKAVYDYFNISTSVCSSSEFTNILTNLKIVDKLSPGELFNCITKAILDSDLILEAMDSNNNPSAIYKIEKPIMSFFNRLQLTDYEDYKSIFLFKKGGNFSNFMFWLEFESIINTIVQIFGPDYYGNSSFTKEERLEIERNEWKGRTWVGDEFNFTLEYDSNGFGLYTQFKLRAELD